ncbi:MAG: FecR domain-containing protein [Alphaproteobacteria bacterium]|nr:FecR domain-containing protein [Alphaproteobacteria bacterium]
MSIFDNLPPEDQERLEVAALWWQRLQKDPSIEMSDDFLLWIAEPVNCRAFKAVESTMSALSDFGATPNILDMRRTALTRLRNAGVKRWMPRVLLARVAAVILVVAVGGGVVWYVRSQAPDSYTTEVGERRVVALVDGSRISLDSDSEVNVRYTDAARAVVLNRGRARFDVAHDVKRPFTVTAGTKTVVAVGTSFDVERLGSTVLVTLIQGHVLIKDAAAPLPTPTQPRPKRTLSMVAGQQLVAAVDGKPVISRTDLSDATAWESGHLVFRGETLAEAVERVNRYTDHPIMVDPSAASIRISGVFNAGDIGSFVSAITGYFPVEATTDANETITLQKRS